MDEYTRKRDAARSRWRIVGQVLAAASAFRSTTRKMKNPQISTGAANPLSSFSSSMTSPISRWRILKHVIVAVVKFQSAHQRRHQASGSIDFPTTDWLEEYNSLFSDLFQSPTVMQGLDPPFGSSPSLSRWRIVKHVIAATLRMQPGRRTASSLKLPDLEVIGVIGEDESSGKIYTAVHRQTGQAYVLKEIPCNSSQQQKIRCEVEILKEMDHPNLVKIYGVFFADDDPGMSLLLLESLHFGSPSVTSESEIASLARQLLLGLTYLHRKRITHGDIKPSNILVDDDGQVKLLYSGKGLSQKPALSAEIGAVHDGFSWDIWSVGMCILKLCKGLNWFERDAGSMEDLQSMPIPAVSEHIQPGMDVDTNRDAVPSSSSSQSKKALGWKPSMELLSLLSACMSTDVQERQTAEKLVEHPFFSKFPKGNEDRLQLPPWEKEVQFSSKMAFQLPPMKMEVQFPPSKIQIPPMKKEHQTQQLKKEFEIPPMKKEFQTQELKKEKHLYHEREELLSPVKKKLKIPMKDDDEDGAYDVESSKDPIGVPKRCIEHCKLFLPDCEFEKDKLVRMWIAEGCIELGVTRRIEEAGNLYFDALVQDEVIVISKFDNVQRKMKYKFNKSQVGLLEQGNYLRISASNMDGIHKEVLHLTWQCKRLDRTFSDALKNFKQLRTLVVNEDCSASISQLPSDIFLGLRSLKTLDLSRTHISEMPGSIGKLEALQYLDVSETPIKRLPESLDCLYCLETLNLRACVGVTALPRGFGRLVNLRHLDLDILSQLKSMPIGMGNLTELQTLQAFIVGKKDGCGIGELKNMNEITGSFCISRLENVNSAKEAKEAALCDKMDIDKLELRWHSCDNLQDIDEILESLQPHFDLKELQLTSYGGSKLPRWISNPAFTDLSSMTLYKCINCDILPSIGELPSLKILHVFSMENVRNINTVFCRNHENKAFNAFPRLEKLTLDSMPALEEWSGVEDGDFHCLRHISLKYCPKLRVLPSLSHLSSLEYFEISNCMQLISLPEGSLPPSLDSLIIRGCPGLNERCRKDGGVDWSKIASVGNIWIDLEKISLN